MILEYNLKKLGLKICSINVKMQKINDSIFKTFEMILTSYQIENKLEKAWFFEETFLLADFNIELVIRMHYFILNNANI